MYKKINKLIEKYNTIIIHRHSNPDMDAIGSQMGLYYLIKERYPNKLVFTVGDENRFVKEPMNEVDDKTFEGSLSIIVDVAVDYMISDDRYKLANEVLVIDHHTNDANIKATTFIDSSYSSASEFIVDIFRSLNYKFNKTTNRYLYAGMIMDTGRFMYLKDAKRTFEIAAFLAEEEFDIQGLYNWLYVEPLERRLLKYKFENRFVFEEGIAYLKNTKEDLEKLNIDTFSASRGMVNLAAGIEEIKIWLNFTYDKDTNKIIGEFRSRGIVIVDVAKSFGGGGHNFACGATLSDWDEVDKVINEYKKLLEENKDES